MKGNQKELDGLIREVMDQMGERGYAKKTATHYRDSFQLLISISHDIGDDRPSQKLIKTFLDRPVSCSEKWAPKNWPIGNAASGCSCRLHGQEPLTGEGRTLTTYLENL